MYQPPTQGSCAYRAIFHSDPQIWACRPKVSPLFQTFCRQFVIKTAIEKHYHLTNSHETEVYKYKLRQLKVAATSWL